MRMGNALAQNIYPSYSHHHEQLRLPDKGRAIVCKRRNSVPSPTKIAIDLGETKWDISLISILSDSPTNNILLCI